MRVLFSNGAKWRNSVIYNPNKNLKHTSINHVYVNVQNTHTSQYNTRFSVICYH